jgi:ACS family sodium-dependent inorganic phosphate cotransporter
MPFWAIAVAHTCGNWGLYVFLVELPTYMKQILRFDIAEVRNLFLNFFFSKN